MLCLPEPPDPGHTFLALRQRWETEEAAARRAELAADAAEREALAEENRQAKAAKKAAAEAAAAAGKAEAEAGQAARQPEAEAGQTAAQAEPEVSNEPIEVTCNGMRGLFFPVRAFSRACAPQSLGAAAPPPHRRTPLLPCATALPRETSPARAFAPSALQSPPGPTDSPRRYLPPRGAPLHPPSSCAASPAVRPAAGPCSRLKEPAPPFRPPSQGGALRHGPRQEVADLHPLRGPGPGRRPGRDEAGPTRRLPQNGTRGDAAAPASASPVCADFQSSR